jgi:hypothetical protein
MVISFAPEGSTRVLDAYSTSVIQVYKLAKGLAAR